jgi:serine/threonine-protein kinase RsbW
MYTPTTTGSTGTRTEGTSLSGGSASPHGQVTLAPTVLSLPAERISTTQARAFVRRTAHDAGFGPESLADIELAVGEAVTNAVLHGHSRSGPTTISVLVEFSHPGLTVEVRDNGSGFDPGQIHQADYADAEAQTGRGLMLIRALMDHVELRRDRSGMTIRMERRLREPEA